MYACEAYNVMIACAVLHPSNSLLTVPGWSFCSGALLPVFGVRVSAVTFHSVFGYTFSSVWIAEWSPFGKERPTRLAVCSHYISSLVILVFPRFGFEGGVWFLIAPVPVHCSTYRHILCQQCYSENIELVFLSLEFVLREHTGWGSCFRVCSV